MQEDPGAPRFDVDDVRAPFDVPGAFVPEFVESRAGGFDVVGSLRLPGDHDPRIRVGVKPPGAPDALVRTPQHVLGATPYLHGAGLADLGPGAVARVRDVLAHAAARHAEVERFRALLAAVDTPWRRHEIPMAGMDGPPPGTLLAEAEAAPGDRVEITLFLRSACLQACTFCHLDRPPWDAGHADRDLATVRELARRVLAPARRRGALVRAVLEADDLARHPRLAEIADAIHRETPFPLWLMAPCNTLAEPGAAARVAALPALGGAMLTLFGATAPTHDAIAGRAGAFREAIRALRNLAAARRLRLGVKILATVPSLDEVRDMVATTRHFRAEATLVYPYDDYRDGNPDGNVALRPLIPRADAVLRVLSAQADAIRASGGTLVDFPDCAVPPSLRDRLVREHAEALSRYPVPGACRRCARADRCARVPLAYLAAHGEAGLSPEPA
ncbi:MAG TPA: hypothetical protein PK313_04450 [Myxococcota bacterium]|nr:hypothetical protein [Myxococcota bacterium]